MKKSRHSTEQIIRILREADAGATTEEVCRKHNKSSQSFYRWRKKYGGMHSDRMYLNRLGTTRFRHALASRTVSLAWSCKRTLHGRPRREHPRIHRLATFQVGIGMSCAQLDSMMAPPVGSSRTPESGKWTKAVTSSLLRSREGMPSVSSMWMSMYPVTLKCWRH